MALLKLNCQITLISGTCGGDIYKRDASGQHITAKQRRVKKQKTQKQIDQMNWYTSLKAEEAAGGPPEQPADEPEDPGTAMIYPLHNIHMAYQRTLQAVQVETVSHAGFYNQQIIDWIDSNWQEGWIVYGLSKEIAWYMIAKWFCYYKYTLGFSSDVAFLAGTTNFMEFISAGSAVIRWFVGLYLAIVIPYILYHIVVNFFAYHKYVHSFSDGQCLIRLGPLIYWGRYVKRPSARLYDFLVGPSLPTQLFKHFLMPGWTYQYDDWFDLQDLYQNYISGLVWNTVYSWDYLETHFGGYAYEIEPGVYRGDGGMYGLGWAYRDIGWTLPGPPFDYINEIF